MSDEKILRPVKAGARIYKIATFDIEATDWTNFLISGFYDGKEYKEFYSMNEMLSYIIRRKYASYRIYAHNGGKYDFLYIMEHLKEPCEIYDINGRIFCIKVHLPQKQTIQFFDSYYILQFSLEKLIEKMIPDTKYKKIDIDFSKLKKATKSLKEHLKNDVFSLFDILTIFQAAINKLGAELKGTSASTSLDLFRRTYLENEIPTYYKHDEQIRKSYFGGRTEVYKKHLKAGFYYDFNSLYPSVMSGKYYPVGYPHFIERYKYSPDDTGFVQISLKMNKYVPILPVRKDNMLLFPNGNITGFYSLEFVRELIKRKIDFRTGYAMLFDRSKLFDGFVRDLYSYRMQVKDNEVMKYSVKLLLNSLYGKFAQKIERKKFYLKPDKKTILKKGLMPYNIYYDIWYEELEVKLPYVLPAISSYVTTYAQLKMLDYINENTYYVDTDSIITTEKIKTNNDLGSLKLEDEIQDGIFITQKVYSYINSKGETKKRAKGFPFDVIKNISHRDYKDSVYSGNYNIFNVYWKQILGWKESLTRKTENTRLLKHEKKVKQIRTIDTKRYFKNINESIPFEI